MPFSRSHTAMDQPNNLTQEEFDRTYITTTEICRRLELSRSTVHVARATGKLPNPVDVQGQLYIWKRADVEPYLQAWKTILDARRGATA